MEYYAFLQYFIKIRISFYLIKKCGLKKILTEKSLEEFTYRFDNHLVHLHVWRRGKCEKHCLRYILRSQHSLVSCVAYAIWHDLRVDHTGTDAL